MTTEPNDLPNSPEECEAQIERLSEDIDGGDVYAILIAAADHLSYESTKDFIENSSLARDIIEITQSNYERAYHDLVKIAELDDRLAELTDGN